MNARVLKPVVLIVIIAVLVTILAAACGGGEPEDLEIPVKLEHEKLDPETIRVKQGDRVTLNIEADGSGKFHLHGYDIEQDVVAGEVTDFFFEADATGRFPITFHRSEKEGGEDDETSGGEEDEHNEKRGDVEIGILEVQPR